MNDGPSNYSSLREEWSLLVHSFLDQQPDEQKLNPDDLSLEQVALLQKDLSFQRKEFNQKIELIKNRIDELHNFAESALQPGVESFEFQQKLSELNFEGEKISLEITKIESKIKQTHELKEKILSFPELAQAQ